MMGIDTSPSTCESGLQERIVMRTQFIALSNASAVDWVQKGMCAPLTQNENQLLQLAEIMTIDIQN